VLSEALAGRRPFEAANDLELLKTIAHGAPPPLPAGTPDAVCAIVEKALEKDPADRYQHMQDLVVDLRRAVRKSAAQHATRAAESAPHARVPWLVAAGLALALAAALVPATWYFLRAPTPTQPARFVIPAPGYAGGLAISPDGQNIAYTATVNGKRQIWVRPIAALEAHALPGTDNAQSPFWSPDGHNLAYYADAKLLKIDASGGPPQALADASQFGAGGSWGRDGTILFVRTAPGAIAAIAKVPAVGGAAAAATVLAPERELVHTTPRFLPDSHGFLFFSIERGAPGAVTLRVGALGDPTTTPLVALGTADPNRFPSAAYVHGVLLYTRDGTLLAQHFDPKTRVLGASVVPLAENAMDVSASDNGTLVYAAIPLGQRTDASAGRQLTWFDRHGNRTGTIVARDGAISANLSPDGGRLAFSGRPLEPDSEIWTVDFARAGPTRRTFEPQNYAPIWSPDGTQILFSSTRASTNQTPKQLYRRAANGTGSDELLLTVGDDEFVVPTSWSQDGRYVIFERTTRATVNTVGDTWVLPLDGERRAFPLIESKSLKTGARLSPDGRWLAYATDESGTRQIVVQPFPAVSDGKWQVSTSGGIEPKWRRDGRELYYLGLDGAIMAVPIEPGATFDAGPPATLFTTGISVPGFVHETYYDVTADGQRFIVNMFQAPAAGSGGDAAAPVPITVVINGTAALEQH
jgi:Tol biopolymer transport system component